MCFNKFCFNNISYTLFCLILNIFIYPWRKFQIIIHSEEIRAIPNHSESFSMNLKNALNLVRCKSVENQLSIRLNCFPKLSSGMENPKHLF